MLAEIIKVLRNQEMGRKFKDFFRYTVTFISGMAGIERIGFWIRFPVFGADKRLCRNDLELGST